MQLFKPTYELEPLEDVPEFYAIPSVPSLAVSKDGRVYDRVKGELMPIHLHTGYPVTSRPPHHFVHRLVAKTFLDKAEEGHGIVNHIDGLKTNADYLNLEWVNYVGNLNHAFKTGLRTDNAPVELKDLRTNEVKKFHSMQECSRYLNINAAKVSRYLKANKPYAFLNRYTLRRSGTPWPKVTARDIGKHVNGMAKDIVAVEVNGTINYIFSSSAAAAEYLNLHRANIAANLARLNGEKPHKGFMFYNLAEYINSLKNAKDTREAIPTKVSRNVAPNRKPIPVMVENTKTGERVEYPSLREFGASVNANFQWLKQSVYTNSGRWKQYLINYLRPETIPSLTEQ